MDRHTPGPWERYDYRIFESKPKSIGRFIAQTAFNASQRTPESEANAQLIAAAPELLAALRSLTEHMDRAGGDAYAMPECPWCHSQRENNEHNADCELLIARAAIAKAEGR